VGEILFLLLLFFFFFFFFFFFLLTYDVNIFSCEKVVHFSWQICRLLLALRFLLLVVRKLEL